MVDTTPAAAAWGLNGQRVAVTVGVRTTGRELKELLSSRLGGMPSSKQQLKSQTGSFLKDTASLAHMNIGDGVSLELSVRSRGGR